MARTPLEALKVAIKEGGPTQAEFAKKIGKNQSYVSMLVHRLKKRQGKIDVEMCPKIEKATNGAVTCQQLRPDFPWQPQQAA